MYQEKNVLDREWELTLIYKNYAGKDKAEREAAFLSYQIPRIFRSFRDPAHEILAGRIDKTLIGFYAIAEGTGCLDQMGYTVNEEKCTKRMNAALQEGRCSRQRIEELEEMVRFWHQENTCAKGQAGITPAMKKSMAGIDYNHDIAMIYPLYRLAGLNLDVKKLCALGLQGLIDQIGQIKSRQPEESTAFYTACIRVLKTLQDVCLMYAEEMDRLLKSGIYSENRKKELMQMKEDLLAVRTQPPATFRQALQITTLYMLASDSREIGRFDDSFGRFYCRDLRSGILTKEEAVRLVIQFFDIIEQEYTRDTRVLIGGRGRENEKDADELALVVLDALDQRPYSYQPQVSLRWYRELDERLYNRSLEILGKGRTFPTLYNDEVNIPSVMRAMDVNQKDAQQYSFFGCGEYMLAGKSIGTPNVLLNLAKILEVTLHEGTDPMTGRKCGLPLTLPDTDCFEDFMDIYERQLDYCCDLAGDFQQHCYDICAGECSWLLQSILTDSCLQRGKALLDGGICHLGGTVETYGNITASDSLAAIRRVVYENKTLSLAELVQALDHNLEDEKLRRELLSAPKFGNDDDDADDLAVWLHEQVCNKIRRQRERTRLDSLLVVVINNSMNVFMGRCSGATPDGRRSGVFLSNANGAYNNCDKEGLTALMRSMTKLDTSIHAGANQNFKLSPSLFKNDQSMIKAILASFFALGGQQTNISVVDQKDLEDAMIHPENHENLIVRVGGYTARFITLDRQTQQDILSRTAY